ncbi:MAG: GNAT family N-acetyltransferase [Brachybacterium tyrofermentans]|uniref:GNAT family N-acetyltransferase n=1 Tax=Brachybacterium tyrofermentans TaxID=47848 RepID=UPI000A1AEBFA|nr:acetyltransferase, putative [Corynebacterium xerosis]
MSLHLSTPHADELTEVMRTLASWQTDGSPFQLHPGDIGWHLQRGADATAAAVRTWSRDGELLAIGMLDGPEVLRLAIAPSAQQDDDLAYVLVQDLEGQGRGVLAGTSACLEVANGARLRDVLLTSGWTADEAWTPLEIDLAQPVEDPGLHIELVGPELAATRAAAHRESFDGSRFTEEHWHTMRTATGAGDSHCLLAFDAEGTAVAAMTVWTAGARRAGLIEPLGVGREHRGRGYGAAITRAGLAMLRELGASRALVATPSANVAAVATYMSAGFTVMPQRLDLRRPS